MARVHRPQGQGDTAAETNIIADGLAAINSQLSVLDERISQCATAADILEVERNCMEQCKRLVEDVSHKLNQELASHQEAILQQSSTSSSVGGLQDITNVKSPNPTSPTTSTSCSEDPYLTASHYLLAADAIPSPLSSNADADPLDLENAQARRERVDAIKKLFGKEGREKAKLDTVMRQVAKVVRKRECSSTKTLPSQRHPPL
mmetsp:Transcript_7188/g.11368  ORF Transcript_7188/g.11368 Transcript_7188/m.11368 type:complete len:204 (-) Transcript_7188:85-696(-)